MSVVVEVSAGVTFVGTAGVVVSITIPEMFVSGTVVPVIAFPARSVGAFVNANVTTVKPTEVIPTPTV